MFNFFRKKPKVINKPAEKIESRNLFSTDDFDYGLDSVAIHEQAYFKTFQKSVKDFLAPIPEIKTAMDAGGGSGGSGGDDTQADSIKPGYTSYQFGLNDIQLNYYSSQGFIGWQTCALLSQQWLIDKACTMPAKDAIRKGYEITVNNGQKLEPEVKDAIRQLDVKYEINRNLVEFIRMGRIFGIRIALFDVRTNNPDEYYLNPFNIDAVTPGSYRGIVQIDPYWITPELDMEAAGNPAYKHFYEPTWWRVNGQRIHYTHLIIYRTEELPDILKPTYIYGGIPIPQKIFERVYAAERTANEAPQLALTKRSTIFHTDLAQAIAQQGKFEQKMASWAYFRDNFGIKIVGEKETVEQFDTSLSELDAVIMTQYQLVAAAANVPATKLLGTTPKGFNSTGEFDEASYHEELESLQTHDLTPLLQRHHLLLIKSEVAPMFKIEPFETFIVWNSLDSMTAKEKAEVQEIKARTGAFLINSGAISPEDELNRLMADPDSGYNDLSGVDKAEGFEDDPEGE